MKQTWKQQLQAEWGKVAVELLGIGAGVSGLFYRSLIGLIPAAVIGLFVVKAERKRIQHLKEDQMAREFAIFLQSLGAALAVGNSMDGGFREAAEEFRNQHKESLLGAELQKLLSGRTVRKPLDELVRELADRLNVEDVKLFAQVFRYVNQCGGDFREIIGKTCHSIITRQELYQEIQDELSARKLELKVMAVTPMGILLYLSMGSPGYLDVLYHNLAGVVIMTICLLIYGLALYWGSRIVQIRW